MLAPIVCTVADHTTFKPTDPETYYYNTRSLNGLHETLLDSHILIPRSRFEISSLLKAVTITKKRKSLYLNIHFYSTTN